MSGIRRREFILLGGGAVAAWPLAAGAEQQPAKPVIGFLAGGSRPVSFGSSVYGGFLQGMRELGYVEGKDFVIEWRFAEGRFELFPDLATELVVRKVNVIVLGSSAAVRPTQQATKTIPIVMGSSIDPVGNGFVASLAHPDGNTTGLASSHDDTTPKQLELLATVVPHLSRVGLLTNPTDPTSVILNRAKAAASRSGLIVVPIEAASPQQLQRVFLGLGERVEATMVAVSAFFFTQRQRIAELALGDRLPTIFAHRDYVEAGGLMSYGESLSDFYRRAAFYVDKILRGSQPRDLPVQQPNRFYLTINLKTAKALGLTVPDNLLARADEVIE